MEKVLARRSDSSISNRSQLRDAIARLDNSTSNAVGLTAEAYTSEEFLQRERQSIFTNRWICVGFGADLPNAGNLFPIEVAGMPIVLVRAPQGEIRAFHNICSHRGLQLVTKPCQHVV